ncbi:transglutaminase family protein [Thalassospira sp.]|uniref:transglutaminase family protein n=1 Tax=Thalassospira sp. TaxID=1912094 RepID=UPI002733EDBE|nr:transglutaminase family protein [Thalassospira sp.]MDP2699378.1 transglutaminase family protein [Thalassospira sp.]
MRLSVEHRTHYRYAPSARYVTQSLKLTPSRFDGQKIIEWSIRAEGCVINSEFIDGYGDTVSTLTASGPVDEVEIVVQGWIETTDLTGLLRGHKEKASPLVFLRSTDMTRSSAAIRKLAKGVARKGEGKTPLEQAHLMAEAVSDAVEYAPGTTHAHTTAADALAAGQGVCQDHTHILLSVARHLGVPARYVSGYLFADSSGIAHEAAHAWAELYVRDIGWIGFDASNRCCPTDYYIRLGSGLDARDASPIRGVHSGGADENLDVTVVVAQSQQ